MRLLISIVFTVIKKISKLIKLYIIYNIFFHLFKFTFLQNLNNHKLFVSFTFERYMFKK